MPVLRNVPVRSMLELISSARSKDRVGLPLRALIGGAQPSMAGGPPSPALYKEREGPGARYPSFAAARNPSHNPTDLGLRSADRKFRRHDVLLRQPRRRPVLVEARRPPRPAPPTAAAGSTPRRSRPPLRHRLHGAPSPCFLCATSG